MIMTTEEHDLTVFDFTAMMTDHVGRFTVGFVGIGEDKAVSMGSGTLARYGKVAGIITCAHVLETLKGDIGVVCFPTRPSEVQRFEVDMSVTEAVVLGTRPWSEAGPDLGFLRLPDRLVAELERHASVLDGERHRGNALAGEPDGTEIVELVCGVVDEVTTTRVQGNQAVTTFTGLLNVGRVVETLRCGTMDVFRFRPVPGPDVTPPESYAGTSGGGLWRLYVKREQDGTYALIQARMVGVAFWEKEVDHELQILCHGQVSVHAILRDAISAKWL
jgi:hypothetical protein